MNGNIKSWIGVVCFLVFLGPNVFAGGLPVENGEFDPIKVQMKSIAEENSALANQNKLLKTELIGLQLEVEKLEQEIKAMDPGYANKVRLASAQNQAYSTRASRQLEELDDAALIEEAQDLYSSGQYMELGEGQRLRELELYDLQFQKQELELDLQERQAMLRDIEGQRNQELQDVKIAVEITGKEAEEARSKVTEAEQRALLYPRNIGLLKMENERLKKRIGQLRKLLSK
jgi:hypothetical protein